MKDEVVKVSSQSPLTKDVDKNIVWILWCLIGVELVKKMTCV